VSEPHTDDDDDDDDDDAANSVEEELKWGAMGQSSERVKQLKIVCHGHLLDCQSIIEALNDYSRVVQEIVLGEYTDPTSCSCHVCTHTVCPVCLLKQFPDELCGSVSIADEQALMSSIQSLVHGGLHTTDSQLLEAYKQWDKENTVRCLRNGCIIKADFLIQLPPKLVSLLSRCQGNDTVYASMVAYIREAVLSKSSLVQSTRFITITPTEMASSLVRVLQIRVKDKPQYQKFKSALFGRNNNNNNNINNNNSNSNSSLPEEFHMKCERLLSGCKVHVPMALHEVHARLGKRLLTSNTKGDHDDAVHSEDFILTSFPTKSDYERQKLQQYFLIGDSQHWLYVARYVNQAELSVDLDDLSGRDDKATSDAVLLEFIAPLKPVPLQKFTSAADITFELDLGLYDASRLEQTSSSSSLGGKFKSLPLYTGRRRRDQGAEAIKAFGDDDDGVVAHHGVIDIEHPVQAWGFTTNSSSPDSYWARVVLRSGSFYLVSTYSSHSDEHPTTGGPVLHCTGAVIGVISERLYKKGTQSAHYVATLQR
jgi:hypothetical protein